MSQSSMTERQALELSAELWTRIVELTDEEMWYEEDADWGDADFIKGGVIDAMGYVPGVKNNCFACEYTTQFSTSLDPWGTRSVSCPHCPVKAWREDALRQVEEQMADGIDPYDCDISPPCCVGEKDAYARFENDLEDGHFARARESAAMLLDLIKESME